MLSLIVACITSLPFFGWAIAVVPILAVLSIVPLYFLVFRKSPSNNNTSCNVIITGGSSGIGLAIARECCHLPNVKCITLIARNQDKLNAAKSELVKELQQEHADSTESIQVVSADVTDYDNIQKAVESIAILDSTFIFCCAGVSHPGYFQDMHPSVFEQQMKLNYLGSVYVVKALLPRMKSGCITLTSSGAGQVGIVGYTAYSPTKFALRGFAESLHMELLASSPSNISVQLAFPTDTNTPGYQEEQRQKPRECHLISESGGLWEAKDVAKKMVKEAILTPNPSFTVSFGLEGWMLTALTAGMSPTSGILDAVTQVALMGIFRFISLLYLNDFWSIVRKYANDKDINTSDAKRDDEKKEQ